MTLFLVRHGECSNVKGTYLGSGSDVSINNIGRPQIEKISLTLKEQIDIKNTLIISSSLKRGKESADLISKALGLNFIIDPRLDEIDFGLWEGLNYEEIMANWRDVATIWYNNPMDITPPKGEPFLEFYLRIKDFYNDLIHKNKDENIVLVTHGGVIQVLLTILNDDLIENRWKYNIGRGEFLKLNIEEDIHLIPTCVESSDFELYKNLVFKEWGVLEYISYPKPILVFSKDKLIGGLSFINFKSPLDSSKALWINSVFIVPNSRGKGIASRLIKYAINSLPKENFSKIYVFTDKPKLYTNLSWKIISDENSEYVLVKDNNSEK